VHTVSHRRVLKWSWQIKLTLYFNLRHFSNRTIGVVTGYREAMRNLLNIFSLKRLPLQVANVLFWVSFIIHTLLFYVLLFHAFSCPVMSYGPSFSRPAFSTPPPFLCWRTPQWSVAVLMTWCQSPLIFSAQWCANYLHTLCVIHLHINCVGKTYTLLCRCSWITQ